MKKMILMFLAGIAVGAFGHWKLQQVDSRHGLRDANEALANGAGKLKESVQALATNINVEEIRKELAHTGVVVREKASQAGAALADATANARTTATIKTKLFAEPGISAMKINVDTTAGVVTLSGTAASPEEVAKIVNIALGTEGVRRVVSTIQVNASK